MDQKWETKHALWNAKRRSNVCLHEAAHAVMNIRCGYAVKKVRLTTDGGGFVSRKSVIELDKPLPPDPPAIIYVAGHVAEHIWGYDAFPLGHRLSGSGSDFNDIARSASWKRGSGRISKSDRAAAREVWRKESKKLRNLARRDPLLEVQVKAVAKALTLSGRLTGKEVESIMEAATISYLDHGNSSSL